MSYSIVQNALTALDILFILPPLPAQSQTATVSTVLPFPCYIVGIIQNVTFSDRFLSLHNMCLMFLHLFVAWCCSFTKLSDSLWPHGLQHARLFCPSLSPRVCSNSCPLSWWAYLNISTSAAPFCFFPFLLLPSIFPRIKVFSSESDLCIRGPKY